MQARRTVNPTTKETTKEVKMTEMQRLVTEYWHREREAQRTRELHAQRTKHKVSSMIVANKAYQCFADTVIEWAEDNGFKVEERYSGKGMYGKQCLGVVVDSLSDAQDLYFHLGWMYNESGESDDSQLPTMSTDNMGLQYILYWRDCASK
jgi:hypothetical protein